MLTLLEYQSKEILRKLGFSVPNNFLISSIEDLGKLPKLTYPVYVKAQVPILGRARRGLIRLAQSEDELRRAVEEMLGREVENFRVSKVLIEEKVEIEREIFISILINESYKVRNPMIIISTEGGTSIEEVLRTKPEKVVTLTVNYLDGINVDELKNKLLNLGLSEDLANRLSKYVDKLYRDVFIGYDAWSVELNPLALTKSGDLVALDVKLVVDDHALFRHPDIKPELPPGLSRPLTKLEEHIWKWEEIDTRGTGYFIQLPIRKEKPDEYYVGFHGIGGGGAMIAVDILSKHGIKVANYADTSGDPPASKVYRVVKTILSQPDIEAYVLLGVVMASQEQWHHAHGIVKALRECLRDKPGFPVIILLAGNKEKEAHEIIKFGLKDMPIRLEVYGREYLDKLDYIAERIKTLIDEYRREKQKGGKI